MKKLLKDEMPKNRKYEISESSDINDDAHSENNSEHECDQNKKSVNLRKKIVMLKTSVVCIVFSVLVFCKSCMDDLKIFLIKASLTKKKC